MTGKVVYNILTNDVDVSAIVGAKVRGVVALAGDDLPYIVYNIISVRPTGVKNLTSPVDEIRTQVSLYSQTYGEIDDLAEKVIQALDGVSNQTINTVNVDYITFQDQTDGDGEETNNEGSVYARHIDFFVRIKR